MAKKTERKRLRTGHRLEVEEKKSKDDAKVSSFMNVSNGVGICFYVTLYLFFTFAQSFHCMGKHYY